MATDSKFRLSYHARLFILLLSLWWVMVVCFVSFQYYRERQYKVERLNDRLQLINTQILDAISDGESFTDIINSPGIRANELRVTILNSLGDIIYDNSIDSVSRYPNHLDREEIRQAIQHGSGYTIRRHSKSTDNTYFYSAMSGRGLIVRSALPYSISLQEVLRADQSFLWFMSVITILLSIIGYFATRKIGRTISRLNEFAEMAEKGERIYDIEAFPNDELGSISNHIVRLYAMLQQTMADRDHQHKLALSEEHEKNLIKKRLTNNINHELKTPVASIQVCLETLLNHPTLEENKRTEFLHRCYDNAERLRRLLIDVSTITRMDDGQQQITKELTNIKQIIVDIYKDVALRLEEKAMDIQINIPDDLAINGNPSLLTSIFRNLIDNAISYSNGSSIIVQLETELSDKYVFSVSDNGVGVDEEHLPRIFERFYRIDKGRSRRAGGTGLGLAIVKNAVILHGGKITVANIPTGGLKFTFSLDK